MKHNNNDTDGLHIVDYTQEAVCSGCGKCCPGFLPLDYQEIDRIQRFVRKHNIKPVKITAPYSDNISERARCPFRNEGKKRCEIYEVRPRICQTFLCNKDQAILLAERTAAHQRSAGTEVDMWAVFGGKTPVWQEIFKDNIA